MNKSTLTKFSSWIDVPDYEDAMECLTDLSDSWGIGIRYVMPEGDYSDCNFESLSLRNIYFTKDSRLPSDKNLFQKIFEKSLDTCSLPESDYSEYNFNDVNLSGCKFTNNSKLPKNKDLFQTIKNKSLFGCKMPTSDYSLYNFDDVNIQNCKFTSQSKLPSNCDFFNKLSRINNDELVDFIVLADFKLQDFTDFYEFEASHEYDKISKYILKSQSHYDSSPCILGVWLPDADYSQYKINWRAVSNCKITSGNTACFLGCNIEPKKKLFNFLEKDKNPCEMAMLFGLIEKNFTLKY